MVVRLDWISAAPEALATVENAVAIALKITAHQVNPVVDANADDQRHGGDCHHAETMPGKLQQSEGDHDGEGDRHEDE